MLIAMTRVDPIDTSTAVPVLVLLTAAVVLVALPGTILAAWSDIGRVILWNASGWALMLLVVGIFSFGYLMIAPLALIVGGLIAWPRAEGQPFVTWTDIMAHLGGFAVLFVAVVITSLVV